MVLERTLKGPLVSKEIQPIDPGRKARINLDIVLRRRDIILLTQVHAVKAMVFSSSHVRTKNKVGLIVGPKRSLSTEELMLSNCGVEEDS